MKIPNDAPGLYRVGAEQNTRLESARTGPVESAASLRPALSENFTETRPREEEKTLARPRREVHFYGEERRKQQRRQQKRPVLLDTRLKQRRQQAAPSQVVNFDI